MSVTGLVDQRDPLVIGLITADTADARKCMVGAGDQVGLICRFGKGDGAGFCGFRLVNVEIHRDFRTIELQDIAVGDVAPENDLFPFALDDDATVTRRMAGQQYRAETGDGRGIVIECGEFFRLDIRADAEGRLGDRTAERLVGSGCGIRIQPELLFAPVDVQDGVFEDPLAANDETAGMV